MNYILSCAACAISCFQGLSYAQSNPVSATEGTARLKAFEQRRKLQETSLVSTIHFRSVGPRIMSGRVVDLEVNPRNPNHFFVAFASGGLWETHNNGLSFTPLFDREAVMTIGDIAVNWEDTTIWVGTGENNSSRSSYSGVGVYRSNDKGKTWKHLGLDDSHHIGKIILHPADKNIAWVAALGHLYSPNKERGVYKTTDGGKSWRLALYVDENTGAIDMDINPKEPDILYATMWDKTRRAWNFQESGGGSGLYRSTDGGSSWSKLNNGKSGLPTGDGVGRMGVALCTANPHVVYCIVDNQEREAKEPDTSDVLTKDKLRIITVEGFLKLPDSIIDRFLKAGDFPEEYTGATVKEKVKKGELKPIALVEYMEDANTLLFDTPVKGAELYRSEDGGITWSKTHNEKLDGLYYTYGYYFGRVHVAAANPDKVFIYGVPLLSSDDGGKTFTSIDKENVHGDFHILWINPGNVDHLICGNDGGLNITYDGGKVWYKANNIPVGQFYAVSYDMKKPYNIYGGLQDNGVWFGPSTYQADNNWLDAGQYPYKFIYGGDGMQVAVDHRDNETVYTGYQFGNYARLNTKTGDVSYFNIKHKLGERPYRFNWQSPIHLSVHNPDIVYFGANKLLRSLDQGKTFKVISGDLTNGGRKGDVPYGTLTAIHESPLKFGLIYTGSDDGLVYVSKDGGNTWQSITTGLPQQMYVSRIQASAFKEERVYLSLNGYRWDNMEAMIYVSEDYGQSWKKAGANLPVEPVNVVREDPSNENVLYVGTDHGLYVSLDRGTTFMEMTNNMPHVAVHDLAIHPRDKEIIVGTHGRSIYTADVSRLQELRDTVLAKDGYLFSVKSITYNPLWGKKYSQWDKADTPLVSIPFYTKRASKVNLTVMSPAGTILLNKDIAAKAGLNFYKYDLMVEKEYLDAFKKEFEKTLEKRKEKDNDLPYFLHPADYKVILSVDGKEVKGVMQVKKKE